MDIPRKLGMLVVCGVPAIVGGGVVFAIFNGSYAAVVAFEFMLLIAAGGLVSSR